MIFSCNVNSWGKNNTLAWSFKRQKSFIRRLGCTSVSMQRRGKRIHIDTHMEMTYVKPIPCWLTSLVHWSAHILTDKRLFWATAELNAWKTMTQGLDKLSKILLWYNKYRKFWNSCNFSIIIIMDKWNDKAIIFHQKFVWTQKFW